MIIKKKEKIITNVHDKRKMGSKGALLLTMYHLFR